MVEAEQTPEVIGRYELLTRLATGGMAELFLARERGLAGLERLVVVKRILPHLADQPNFVEMFLREARIVARLSHPNVVQIYELGQEADSYHIAMEYIHGSTVRELLVLAQKQDRRMPFGVAVAVAEQACLGLDAAHELNDLDGQPLGLVHRDVSPHNLMCATDGHVKLLDFGVAKSTSAAVEATYSGNLKGKFAYLSPEQCRHEELDRRSDIFAMGIVMWEMVTMRRLFKRETELEMMQAVIGGDVPPPSKYCQELPEGIEAVIMKALATDRDERYETARQMREDLREAADDAGLELGEERVAAFLSDVAGQRLAERRETVENACERELTVSERSRLLHMTGTSSRQESGVDGGLGAESSSAPTDPEQIQKLVDAERSEPGGGGATGETSVERPDLSTATRTDTDDESGGADRIRRVVSAAVLTIGVGVVAALGLVALSGEDAETDRESEVGQTIEIEEDYSVSGEPLVLGWPPIVDPPLLEEEVEPLHQYLEREIGRPVPVEVTDSYLELSRQLRDGEVDIAVLTPASYVLTTGQYDGLELLVMREFDGTLSTDGYLLVRRGEGNTNPAQLEGEAFCFVDEASTSGHLLPRHFLRNQGWDPDQFVGDIHWSGDHFQAMRDLIDGKCEAAAVYSGAHNAAEDYGISVAKMSMLATTGSLPQDAVVVRKETDPQLQQRLIDALAGFEPNREFGVEYVGENQRITGFVEREDEVFDRLREIAAEEGLELDDL